MKKIAKEQLDEQISLGINYDISKDVRSHTRTIEEEFKAMNFVSRKFRPAYA